MKLNHLVSQWVKELSNIYLHVGESSLKDLITAKKLVS
jgi:hypothetical protein